MDAECGWLASLPKLCWEQGIKIQSVDTE
ncbi:uncharacterized protein METZ01_LOCUS266676 [marine metagenome]|uniref:Uncharacterized protein n=1 Tax=marine metagenome TaxID=408172 RepID=A0A382JR63_9ZZZZ